MSVRRLVLTKLLKDHEIQRNLARTEQYYQELAEKSTLCLYTHTQENRERRKYNHKVHLKEHKNHNVSVF